MSPMMMALLAALPMVGANRDLGPMDPGVPTYVCERTLGAIKVDGKLDEASWQKARSTRPFVFPWPGQTGPKQRTTAKLLWDDDALYVGFTCSDTDITAIQENRDDPTYKDDCVEVFLCPAPMRAPFYYGQEMNARGVMYDYFMAYPVCLINQYDLKGYELATSLVGTLNDSTDHDVRWYLEVKLPFKNYDGLAPDTPPKDDECWRLQMNRWDGTGEKRALSEWTPSGQKDPDPHRPQGFGILQFSSQPAGSQAEPAPAPAHDKAEGGKG